MLILCRNSINLWTVFSLQHLVSLTNVPLPPLRGEWLKQNCPETTQVLHLRPNPNTCYGRVKCSSTSKTLTWEIPQGSIFFLILFSIYIKQSAEPLKQHRLKWQQHLDNTQLCVSFMFSINSTVSQLSQPLARISTWMKISWLKRDPPTIKGICPQIFKSVCNLPSHWC